jgi:hypothetical protein
MENLTQLKISIKQPMSDDIRELEQLTYQLRDEIKELDVEKVGIEKSIDEIPKGAKTGEIVTFGNLLVHLAPSVIPSIINSAISWLSNHKSHSITVEIDGDKLEVTNPSSEQQKRLIDTWIRHRMKKGEASGL